MTLPQKALEPIERISEVLFGLIMVLTATGTLSVVNAGNPEIKTMILGALGCNLAWGIIDGGLYLLGRLEDRGRNLMTVRAVKQAAEPAVAQRAIADALPEPITASLSPEDLDLIARKLNRKGMTTGIVEKKTHTQTPAAPSQSSATNPWRIGGSDSWLSRECLLMAPTAPAIVRYWGNKVGFAGRLLVIEWTRPHAAH